MHPRQVFLCQTDDLSELICVFSAGSMVSGGKVYDPTLNVQNCAVLALWWWI